MSSFTRNIQKALQQNIREYGMYIVLFAIMAFFTVATNGTLHFGEETSPTW